MEDTRPGLDFPAANGSRGGGTERQLQRLGWRHARAREKRSIVEGT